ncbi:MAG: hypothetical protein ACFE85_12280 [Candidatus Hodarchaeota archaeon]
MASSAINRCPRCGNDNRIDSYVCAFCGKRLRIEKIESYSIFKRIESEWISPAPWYTKILWLFTKPNKAFWDINHKRDKSPGYLILLINSLLYGLLGLAFFSHFNIVNYPVFAPILFLYNLSIFLAFFIFGAIFYFIFGLVMVWLFTRGANIAVNFSERLEARFEGRQEELKYREEEMSPFSIYKGGTLQQQQAHKNRMMFCAFAPFLLINTMEIIIVLTAFPTVSMDVSSFFNPAIFSPMFNSPTWTVLHIIDALTLAIWVPLLISLSIRELANSSTFRVLISSIAIGVLVAIIFYFLRPTIIG